MRVLCGLRLFKRLTAASSFICIPPLRVFSILFHPTLQSVFYDPSPNFSSQGITSLLVSSKAAMAQMCLQKPLSCSEYGQEHVTCPLFKRTLYRAPLSLQIIHSFSEVFRMFLRYADARLLMKRGASLSTLTQTVLALVFAILIGSVNEFTNHRFKWVSLRF